MSQPEQPEPAPLDPRDEQVADLLAAGKTEVEVAAELNVSRSTVQRVARKPEVRSRVRCLRTGAAAEVSGLLLGTAREAVDELRRLIRSGAKDEVKLRAATAVLQMALGNVALSDLEQDMKELRERLEAPEPKPLPPWLLPENPAPDERPT